MSVRSPVGEPAAAAANAIGAITVTMVTRMTTSIMKMG